MRKDKYIRLLLVMVAMLLFAASTVAASQATQYNPLGVNSTENMIPNGEYEIYVFTQDKWQEVGKIAFDKFFRERAVDLGSFLSDSKEVKVKIVQKGGGTAHIDSVLLGGTSPVAVEGIQDGLKKLSKKDFDVVDAFGKEILVTFTEKSKDNVLKLTARVENTVISKTPFQFPVRNLFREMNGSSEFYTYTTGSKNESGRPLFKEYSRTGSGHPSGFTYGWVSNDDKNMYVRIDFTPDNTMDGDKDYAKVYVKKGEGVKEFKVSVPEQKWGNPDFTYTDNVAYQHKVYDFTIPFSELGLQDVKDGENLQLAFAAYGTASPGDYSSDIAYDPTNNRYLVVFARWGTSDVDVYGQLVNCDGTAYDAEFVIYNSDTYLDYPKVAYDSDNHRFLVVWMYNSNIYGQLVHANGMLSGGVITISDADNSQEDPDVTYDNVNHKFLVVWIDRRNYSDTWTDVYGQLVNADGSLDGDYFIICDNDAFQHSPSVAFDSTYERFLVSWEDLRGYPERDIYGQLLEADGLPNGGDFVICDADEQQWSPQISNDSTNHRFLVVWNDDRNSSYYISDIYGQLINAIDGSLNGGNFVISDATDAQISPEAVFDKANDRFLVVWRDDRNSSLYRDIYGQFIGVNGSLNGNNFVVADSPDIEYNVPHIAYNPNFKNFLVLYDTHKDSVYDFALSLIGPPCVDLVCRSAGFWGTHAGTECPKKQPNCGSRNITRAVIDACGECIEVCGEVVRNTEFDDADSAVEAMCIAVKSNIRLQLARQLTAASLNCCVSGAGSDCAESPAWGFIFSGCNRACAEQEAEGYQPCIAALDCLNSGRNLVNIEPVTCQPPLEDSCAFRPLCNDTLGLCFNGKQEKIAGSANACNAAIKSACSVIPPGESKCIYGTKEEGLECCGFCGDGECSPCEDADTCATDCGCAAIEDSCGEPNAQAPGGCYCDCDCINSDNCCPDAEDVCGISGSCGDGTCNSVCEDIGNCPADCVVCGNGSCDPGENEANCPDDCTVCGNGICGPHEDDVTCTLDCGCAAINGCGEVAIQAPAGCYCDCECGLSCCDDVQQTCGYDGQGCEI